MHYLAGAADRQTPLDPDEAAQLIPSAIATRGELDLAEQANISTARRWAFARARSPETILDEQFLRRLHKRMLGAVWRWAGRYRTTSRNIGVDVGQIAPQLGALLGDTRYWIKQSTYDVDEICVRFHHRLVAIHPFPNGNGRHARLAADVLAVSLGAEPFGWGSQLAGSPAEARTAYVNALREADDGYIDRLLAFARS